MQIDTREYTEVGIAEFEIWHECSFQKNIQPVFFLSAMGNVEGVKTTFSSQSWECETYFVKYLENY